jgi:hypothetical protein
MYGRDAKPFSLLMREVTRQNRALIRNNLLTPLETARRFLDAQYLFASEFAGLLRPGGSAFSGHGQEVSPAFAAFGKNLFHLYAALDLTARGVIGPSRVLFRVILEALYLGKFCVVSGDDRLVHRWLAGKPVSLTADVFRRIAAPKIVEGRTLWAEACRLAHASVFSGQFLPEFDNLNQEAGYSLAVLLGLLLCNHHLLGQHLLTPGIWYFHRRYMRQKTLRMERRRTRCWNVAAQARPLITDPTRQFVREYVAKWRTT